MKYDKNLNLIVLFALMAVSSGQVISYSACPENVEIMESFDIEQYLGKWYEYSKYPAYFESFGKCITAEYSVNADGQVNVINCMVNEKTNEKSNITGTASLVSPAKLLVKFAVLDIVAVSSNYWILATDYDNYSVVYACNAMTKSLSATLVWILTRQQLPANKVIENALSVLRSNNISLVPLTNTNHASC